MNFSFENYDRITDTLMYFVDNIALKFTVSMSRSSKTGERRFFHYEVEKPSKYQGGDPTRNINRNMSFYFTIDIKDDFNAGFVIRPGDAYMLLDVINKKVLPWYYGESKKNAFQYINNTLTLKEYKPVLYTKTDISYLQFEPCVINIRDQFSYGCRMSISGMYTVDILLEQLLEFVRFLNTDMYATACAMVTYAKTPPYGVGLYRPSGLGGGRFEDNWGNDAATDFANNKPKSRKGGGNSFLDSI